MSAGAAKAAQGAPAPVYLVHAGDCLEWLRSLAPASVDAVVCDPPYGLGFMGRAWDALPPGRNWAEACLRVLKPGGHLLAAGGTRTVHRLAVALEDAGFEIRDMVGWVYYSGFPKSLDVSKAIDAAAGATREVVGTHRRHGGGRHTPVPDSDPGCVPLGRLGTGSALPLTAPATPDAVRWAGWGTALKPAIEPFILARKPLEGTVAANLLAHGVGALNIDGCRFAPGDPAWVGPQHEVPDGKMPTPNRVLGNFGGNAGAPWVAAEGGRFPANLYYCPKAPRKERERGCAVLPARTGAEAVDRTEGTAGVANPRAGAGRTAAAVRNHHPTVKPVRLMRWLVRLVTPPGGIVIDPFLGSGTTGVAALLEGFDFAGCEREPDFVAISEARMAHAAEHPDEWASTATGVAARPGASGPAGGGAS